MKPYKEQTYYELLEIDPSCSMDEIRAAYERAIRLYDAENVALYPVGDPAQVEELKKLLLEAMEILTEPDLRIEYDRSLGLPERPREPAPAAPPPSTASNLSESSPPTAVTSPPVSPVAHDHRPAPLEVAHQLMSEPPGPAEIDARAASSRLEAEHETVEQVRAHIAAEPPAERERATEQDEDPAAEGRGEPAQLVMTEVVARAESVHSTAPRYSISYIPHSPPAPIPDSGDVAPGVPDEPVAASAAIPSTPPPRPASTPARPMPVVTSSASASVPLSPERPASTPARPMPVVTSAAVPAFEERPAATPAHPMPVVTPAAVPPSTERPAATPAQPMPVPVSPSSASAAAPYVSAPYVAPSHSASPPAAYVAAPAEPSPGGYAPPPSLYAAAESASGREGGVGFDARPESGRYPVIAPAVPPLSAAPTEIAPPATAPPVPTTPIPPAVAPVTVAPPLTTPPTSAPPAAIPAPVQTAPVAPEHRAPPRRSTPARGLEQAPLIAQESAIAAAESALAQVSAHVAQKAREPRPSTRPFELPADAVINGELLRQIRQSRGLTLQQLSERTRITTRHIENVEADKYDALPATVYLRGILMNLARELGVDPLRIAKGYLAVVEQSVRKK